MRGRVALALCTALMLTTIGGFARADEGTVGLWLAPFSEDGDGDGAGDFASRPPLTRAEAARLPTAVNSVVLPDGRILYWSQLDGTESVDMSIGFQQPAEPRGRTRLLDLSDALEEDEPPAASAWSAPDPEDAAAGDLVGSDQVILADGRVLVVGGTKWANEDANRGFPNGYGRTELYALPDARLFDPDADTWTRVADMQRARYYPSTVTLPDGRALAVGGVEKLVYDTGLAPGARPPARPLPRTIREDEIFDPATATWTLLQGARPSLPAFAHLHLLPNGKLLYPAVGMLFPPGGSDPEAGDWNTQRWFDPVSGAWSDAGAVPLGVRSNAFSVMLPLQPPYDRAQVLVGGGTLGQWPGGFVATPLTEIVTWKAGADRPERALGPALSEPRWHSSAVVLPTGEVIALSGADKDEVIDPGSGVPVRHAEMFDPKTNRWVKLASAMRDRTLHNTAVLLRDGSILVGGHSPAPAHYGAHATNPAPFSNNFKDPSFEIFKPPYLFRGPRPTIDGLSDPSVDRGSTLTIDTPDAANGTLRVVLSRLPAVTHTIDNDQRTVVLEHDAIDADSVAVEIPDAASVVPPGSYYVFLLKNNGSGETPSVAEIIHVA